MSEAITFEKMSEYIVQVSREVAQAEKALSSAKRNVNVHMQIAGFSPNYFAGQNQIEKGEHCFNCKKQFRCAIFVASDAKADDAPICRYFERNV